MKDHSFDVKDKVAVITGGGGVICSTLGKALAQAGAKVALLDLNGEGVSAFAARIVEDGGDAIGIKADVLSRESVEAACQTVLDHYGTVDILINGAGGNKAAATTGPEQSFFDLPQDALQWVSNLNLLGSIVPSQIFGKVLAEKRKGVIINISSMAAYRPLTKTIAYSAAKAAISNFTQWLSVHMNLEYSPEIRVNAIAPGFLLTEQNRYLLTDQKTGQSTPRGKAVIDHTPMGKYGTPEELVGPVIFLCSDAASFVNGVVLPVDGGFSAYCGV